MKASLETNFAGVVFKNPIVLASGTCGFGQELREWFNPGRLGGLCSKGLTLNARSGNGGIRVWETASGMMNSVGLENPGVRCFIERELILMKALGTAVIVNLAGHSIDDYLEAVELLNAASFDLLELNISCPNLKAGGAIFGADADRAGEVVRKVRAVCKHKLVVKLSPAANDIVGVARTCQDEGADALSLVNTFPAMAIDTEKRSAVFDNIYAGLSGPAIKPIALRMVHQVAKAVSIPVMGIGGITTAQDAIEFIMAGAHLVQVGSANFINPLISLEILEGLQTWLDSKGLASVGEIRGVV
ncbi:MAG: dihydroorotate dehydrogenase [Spirochaetes bacterium]|nr:dihydroorotate dehydrogenase [Spirochaetota bacterium]